MATVSPVVRSVISPVVGDIFSSEGPTPIFHMPLSNSLLVSKGIGPATLTRATIGTYIDKEDGLLKEAAINTARFEAGGVLIEGASSNLQTFSESLDDASWTKTSLSVTANNAVAIDGTTTADLAIPAAVSAQHFYEKLVSVTSGDDYTQTVFADSGGYDFIQLTGSTGFAAEWVNFNLSNGSVGNSSLSTGLASIVDLGGGIYRCRLSLPATSTTTGGIAISVLNADTASRLPSFTGDGSSGVNVWGNQFEPLEFASSYMKTEGATASRSAERLAVDSDNIPAPALNYSVSCYFDLIGNVTGDEQCVYSVSNESLRFIRSGQGLIFLRSRHGASQVDTPGAVTINTTIKVTQTCDTSNAVSGQNLYMNGVATTGAITSVTGTKSDIRIGVRSSAEHLYGHIKSFKIFDKELTSREEDTL